ncbi:hypothetical protein KKF61_07045 [Patescibacteria group bacterium]|nr:hypothetical protein [Patescibacteria group bacterium]
MSREAQFEVISNTDEVLGIRDIGPWDKYLSVTNDAENVVIRLFAAGLLKEGKRLLYEDSEGELDAIIVANGEFVRFR